MNTIQDILVGEVTKGYLPPLLALPAPRSKTPDPLIYLALGVVIGLAVGWGLR